MLNHAVVKVGYVNIGTNYREEHVGYYKSFGFKPAFRVLKYEDKIGWRIKNAS